MSTDLYATGYRRKEECVNLGNINHPLRGHEGKYIDISDFVARWGVFNEKSERRWNAANTKVLPSGEVEANEDCVRWEKGASEGHHPCKGLGESTLILDSPDFDSDFGFTCQVPPEKVEAIINEYKDEPQVNGSFVIDTKGVSQNFYDQILWGGSTKSGKSMGKGFCWQHENINAKVGKNGESCFQLIQEKAGSATADEYGFEYCKNNRQDVRCACLNVTGLGWAERCKQHPEYAGCDVINQRFDEIEKILCPEPGDTCPTMSMYGGNADCLAPGICSGTQAGLDPDKKAFRPRIPLPACEQDLNICNQLIIAKDLEAVGELDINQTCNIDVDGLMKDRAALDLAVQQAKKSSELWEKQQYELQLRRDQKIKEDSAAAEQARAEMRADQLIDREADRTLAAQLMASRFANVEKRRGEREAREDKMKADELMRELTRRGQDAQTIMSVVSVIVSAIFALIVAFKM